MALYRVRGRDLGSVGRVSLKLSGVQDPEYALYLCVELARAYEALRLGGNTSRTSHYLYRDNTYLYLTHISLVSQRPNRVHPRRAPRRVEAGYHAH